MTPQKILAVQNFVVIFQKFLDFFSSNSEKNIVFRSSFSQKILLNDYDFGQFFDSKKNLGLQNIVGIFQKFLDFFSSNSEKNIIFRDHFSRKILLNDYDFWQFSINPWYVRVYGK